MKRTSLNLSATELVYPESDGKRMAENTKQYDWITFIKSNLDIQFANNSSVFVAGDLLWYPVHGRVDICTAPDVMVALGRPKGHRGSYKQWDEGNVAPQVVFEILSPGNTKEEMAKKLNWYAQYGVVEYYIYDPDKNKFQVYMRSGDMLREESYKTSFWESPLLNIAFELGEEKLDIYYANHKPFLSHLEYSELFYKAQEAAEQAQHIAEEAQEMAKMEQKAKEEAQEMVKMEQKAKEEALHEIELLKKALELLKNK